MDTLVEDDYLLLKPGSIFYISFGSTLIIMMMEPKPEGDVVVIEVITYRITLVP